MTIKLEPHRPLQLMAESDWLVHKAREAEANGVELKRYCPKCGNKWVRAMKCGYCKLRKGMLIPTQEIE